jgi:predicted metal-dependent HD superfamily phosphohydrolase
MTMPNETASPGVAVTTDNIHEGLRQRWHTLVAAAALDQGKGLPLFEDLAEAYSSPDRHYHTLEHLRAVLDALTRLGATEQAAPALFLAAWFHDAVYDSRASDNEEQSARLAEATLRRLGATEAIVEETSRLILLTRTHVTAEDDIAGQQLLDADLAILGERPEVYADYARAIRQEYAWVAEGAYRAGRGKVLQAFLQRQTIFRTPLFRQEREEQARTNLQSELVQLSAG